jgi:hypothetical protein
LEWCSTCLFCGRCVPHTRMGGATAQRNCYTGAGVVVLPVLESSYCDTALHARLLGAAGAIVLLGAAGAGVVVVRHRAARQTTGRCYSARTTVRWSGRTAGAGVVAVRHEY